jgi:hypothetical protein
VPVRVKKTRQDKNPVVIESGGEFSRKNDISLGRKRDKMTVSGKTS